MLFCNIIFNVIFCLFVLIAFLAIEISTATKTSLPLPFETITTSNEKKCVITQNCVNSENPDCIPTAYEDFPKPMMGGNWTDVIGGGICVSDSDCFQHGTCTDGKCVCYEDGVSAGEHCNQIKIQCPQYRNLACCSWQQNADLAVNLKLITSTFGKNERGGCDACAINLMNLWCGVTCSPIQSNFLSLHSAFPSTNIRPNPLAGGKLKTVLEMNLTLSTALTCQLYESCKNTAMASIAEAMKSSLGFLKFQAQTGAIGHGAYYFLSFDNEVSSQTSFYHPIAECSNYSEVRLNATKWNLPAQALILPSIQNMSNKAQCPCGACKATCSSGHSKGSQNIHTVDNPISIFIGFDTKTVFITYFICIISACFLLLYRNKV